MQVQAYFTNFTYSFISEVVIFMNSYRCTGEQCPLFLMFLFFTCYLVFYLFSYVLLSRVCLSEVDTIKINTQEHFYISLNHRCVHSQGKRGKFNLLFSAYQCLQTGIHTSTMQVQYGMYVSGLLKWVGYHRNVQNKFFSL